MAVKLILTQIMKDESHVAKRMLDSIKNIVDGICVVDTGSTDDSIEIVVLKKLEKSFYPKLMMVMFIIIFG